MKTNNYLSATILCTLLIWLECNYPVRAEAESVAPSQKGEITIEEAIKIARTAIKKERSWNDIKITSAALRQQKWYVLVWRVPERPGSHATVVISETGEVVRIEPGQ